MLWQYNGRYATFLPGNKKGAKLDGSQKTGNVSQEPLVSVVKEKVQAAASKSSSSFFSVYFFY